MRPVRGYLELIDMVGHLLIALCSGTLYIRNRSEILPEFLASPGSITDTRHLSPLIAPHATGDWPKPQRATIESEMIRSLFLHPIENVC